jgi:hypothetical protein
MSASAAVAAMLAAPAVLAASTPSMSLSPSPASVTGAGQMVLVTVRENSVDLPVNAVQANVSYPSDKLELKYVNYTGGAFNIQAEETKTDGLVKMARGRDGGTSVKGDQQVATLTFVTKSAGTANLGFAAGSVVVNATTNQDVHASLMGATVSIAPAATPTPSPSPTKTPTPSPTASPSASPKPTSSPKATASPTPSSTPVGGGSDNTPTTLPDTGAAAGIMGLGVIGGSTYLYMRSKRSLVGSLRRS